MHILKTTGSKHPIKNYFFAACNLRYILTHDHLFVHKSESSKVQIVDLNKNRSHKYKLFRKIGSETNSTDDEYNDDSGDSYLFYTDKYICECCFNDTSLTKYLIHITDINTLNHVAFTTNYKLIYTGGIFLYIISDTLEIITLYMYDFKFNFKQKCDIHIKYKNIIEIDYETHRYYNIKINIEL